MSATTNSKQRRKAKGESKVHDKQQQPQETSKSILALDVVTTKLKIESRFISNAYLSGSWLWKTAGANSDYDILMVVADKCPQLTASSEKGFASIHSGNLDALIMSRSLYQERLEQHSMYEMLTLWLPEEHIICEAFDPKVMFELNVRVLERAVRDVIERDWSMAQKYTEKGNIERGKKTIVHALRVVMFALQIAENHRITDYAAATDIHQEMKWCFEKEWTTYHDKYRPIMDETLQRLSSL
eukprot:TRINITY_DN222_c0_g4_i1.p1 TRINITY_DN222_c0_g4~~TRINITY_DN222_c0_g4_i1.p1  ORF type:complete len:242 (-),score=58.26 TRINITY_DN222_c0_g4_i1:41-766(-)